MLSILMACVFCYTLSCSYNFIYFRVDRKMSVPNTNYSLPEAHAILSELRNIQKSLLIGQKEKAELLATLARMRDNRGYRSDRSLDSSLFSLTSEKISTASQTDISGEVRLLMFRFLVFFKFKKLHSIFKKSFV